MLASWVVETERIMKKLGQLQTMAIAYKEICEGRRPWTALGNFMNDWFDYAPDKRELLVADPLALPEKPTPYTHRWAAYIAASVEFLCARYDVPCPEWVYDPLFVLSEPWYDSPGAERAEIRSQLRKSTPEPFRKRNIYCDNNMYEHKSEAVEKAKRFIAKRKQRLQQTI